MKKAVQYYKVVNTRQGHYGFFYKLGLNTDPNPIPLKDIRSCSRGALYFTTLEHLAAWAETGDSIAWITPVSPVKKDEDFTSTKWKAHSVKITKLLPIKKALPFLFKELTLYDCEAFGMNISEKMVMESSVSLFEKLQWLLDNDKSPVKLLAEHSKNTKLISHVIDMDYDWTISESKALIKAGLHQVIEYEAVNTLIRNNEWKTLKLLVDADYKKFLQLISQF